MGEVQRLRKAGGSVRTDGVVIGGGAAGLYAAFWAASQGSRVLLLEKNERLGKKLLHYDFPY